MIGRWSASANVLVALLLSGPLLNEAQDNTTSPTATPARQCSGDNRGWLTSGADTGEHPRGNFGPVGLHSAHFLTPTETSDVSTTVILGGKATSYYYPSETYQIKLRCTPSCAFLLTVESGSLDVSGAEQQEGSFVGVEDDARLALYEGLKSYVAVTNTNFITSAYTIFWRAPDVLTYQPLTVRVTWVLDNEFQCPGIFTELVLTSEIVCGDGYKAQYEDCDDDNLIAGDGCSPTCEVEIGWVCDERQRLSICTQALVLFTPADPYEISTVEGYETQYYMVLTTPIQESKFVYILVTAEPGGEAFIVGDTSFEFAAVGPNGWNVTRTVVVSASGNRLVDHRRRYTISHVLSSTDPNYEHNYGIQGANLEPPQMTVIIEDDDGVDIILSRVNITVSEGGSDEFYTISLGSEPSGSVHIAITSEPEGQIFVTPNAIFDASNWDQEIVISVAAIDNSNLDGTVIAEINHHIYHNGTTDDNYKLLDTANKTIRVTVKDNDTPGLVVSPRSLSVTESQPGSFYMISLLSNNEEPVRIDFVTSEGIEAIHTLGSYCIFEADGVDWEIPKYINVRAINNSLQDGERVETVTHTLTSEYLPYNNLADTHPWEAPWEILVYVSDDDVAAVVHGDLVNITEGQDASKFSMHLLTQPTAPVRVYFELEDASYVKIGLTEREGDQRYIEWLPDEWFVTKTITLEALADSEYPDSTDNGVRETKMYMLSWSDDSDYNDILNKPVQVLVYDNDYATVIVEPTTGIELNEGSSAVFTVHLATKPQANPDSGSAYTVNIQMTFDRQLETSPSTLTFTGDDYMNPQSVTVTAVDDVDVEANVVHGGLIQFQVTSQDPQYNSYRLNDMRVTIIDNDSLMTTQDVSKYGGTISPMSPYGAVVVNIPALALPNGASLTIGEAEKPPSPGVQIKPKPGTIAYRVSGTYTFEPHGITFQVPVQINVEYDTVSAEAAGGFMVWYRSDSNIDGPWEVVPGGTFNNGLASLNVETFSLYYVGASPPAPPPPMQSPPAPVDPCEGLVAPGDDEVSDAEYALISILAGENLLAMVFIAMYIAYRKRNVPRVIHMSDDMQEQDGMLALPSNEKEDGVMALPGPYDGRVAVAESSKQNGKQARNLRAVKPGQNSEDTAPIENHSQAAKHIRESADLADRKVNGMQG